MRVLVTGGTGFVGGEVVRQLLARGDRVRSLARSPQQWPADAAVEAVQGSFVDPPTACEACREVDAVIHVAAKAGVWGGWDSYAKPNLAGTRSLLDAARRAGVRFFVHTSTPSVVFSRESIAGGDESLPYGRKWLCNYAATKALAEEAVLAANAPDFRTVALRPHLVWGAGDPHLLPRAAEAALAGRLRIVGNGHNRVDLTHVSNAAAAHLDALDALVAGHEAAGRAFFLSDGEPVELWPWLNGIFRRAGLPKAGRPISTRAAYAAGAVAELVWKLTGRSGEPPMTRFVALQLSKDHWFDISAARERLGYTPVAPGEAEVEAAVADLKSRLARGR